MRLAPPGAARFQPEDLLRLDRWALCLLFSGGPAAIPPADLRAALPSSAFEALLSRLPTGMRARLTSPEPGPAAEPRGRGPDVEGARRRVVAGSFWLLVYSLEPDMWDALSRSEVIPPGLLDALPDAEHVLEVAAGTGRLTSALVPHAQTLVAVEPSRPLAALLGKRVPKAWVVSGVGQALPVRSGWAELTVSCASFGPDAPLGGAEILSELERCTRRGGTVALVGPEDPDWFAARGYERRHFEPAAPIDTPAELRDFFGPHLQPPADLLLKQLS